MQEELKSAHKASFPTHSAAAHQRQKDQQPEGYWSFLEEGGFSLEEKLHTRSSGAARQSYGKAGSLKKPDGEEPEEDMQPAWDWLGCTDRGDLPWGGQTVEHPMQLGTTVLRQTGHCPQWAGWPLKVSILLLVLIPGILWPMRSNHQDSPSNVTCSIFIRNNLNIDQGRLMK